jgi:hypothetical protein
VVAGHHPNGNALVSAAIHIAGIFEGHGGVGGMQTAYMLVAEAVFASNKHLKQRPIFAVHRG